MTSRHVHRWCLGSLLLVACGGAGGAGTKSSNAGADGDEQVEEKVILEKQPDGSIKKTTVRTTRRLVPATPPPARPEDPYPSDVLVRYNVERVNWYREQKKLPPVLYDTKISAFATRGSEQLGRDHTAHAHFAANAKGATCFGSRAAENQGDPSGVPPFGSDRVGSGKKQIDIMLKLMMDEGPGGGHYENMMNPQFRRIGIGLVNTGGKLYLTNDFSD